MLYQVEIRLTDDNKDRIQHEVVEDVTLEEANRFVEAWNNSGYDKPGKFDHITVTSVTGGSYCCSPLNVFGIKVVPYEDGHSVSVPDGWEFKFTYPHDNPVKESLWCDITEQEINWNDNSPIMKVCFRKQQS